MFRSCLLIIKVKSITFTSSSLFIYQLNFKYVTFEVHVKDTAEILAAVVRGWSCPICSTSTIWHFALFTDLYVISEIRKENRIVNIFVLHVPTYHLKTLSDIFFNIIIKKLPYHNYKRKPYVCYLCNPDGSYWTSKDFFLFNRILKDLYCIPCKISILGCCFILTINKKLLFGSTCMFINRLNSFYIYHRGLTFNLSFWLFCSFLFSNALFNLLPSQCHNFILLILG